MRTFFFTLAAGAMLTLSAHPALAQGRAAVHSQASATSADWPVFGGDLAHTNANPSPSPINASNASSLVRRQITVDGIVDASVIYLKGVTIGGSAHDTIFATTRYGETVAVDIKSGALLWKFDAPGFDASAAPREITNTTPVADPNRQSIYTATSDGKVVKLSIANGSVQWSTSITKLATREKIASPLTYYQGHIFAVTAGYVGDAPPYQGHVAVLDAGTGQVQHIWNSLCSDRHEIIDPASCTATRSAIWGRAGVVIDQTGHLFVATGNGPWDGKTSWGDATIELNENATDMLGNWTPTNNEELQRRDQDVGSTSPVLLGDGYIAQGGKDGTIRLLSLDVLKGTEPHRGGELQVVETPSKAQLLTAPAVMKVNGTTWMFAADRGATEAWTFGADHQLKTAWKDETGGTSPTIAGGLLFVYNPGATGGIGFGRGAPAAGAAAPAGSLRVYEATTGKIVATLECGAGHWNSPIVADGRVILPEGSANNRDTSAKGIINVWALP